MRILYHSAPPMADTGYGTHTRELVSRLRHDFDIDIHSVGGWDGMSIDWQGIQVHPPGAGKHGEHSIPYWFDRVDADIVFSHHDHWAMSDTFQGIAQSGIPLVLYTVLDHDIPGGKPPAPVIQANRDAYRTVLMSEWAVNRARNSPIPQDNVSRIPHGVDTTKFAPAKRYLSQDELKEDMGIPKDCFLFGMVAANYGPRKNIPQHMNAFKRLLDDHDDVYFYIHTHDNMEGGYNLEQIRQSLDLPNDRFLMPEPHEMRHGVDDLTVVQALNTFDVHLNVTQSESWGLTVTEAMSCGTPVIAANNSAMTEQFGVDPETYVTQDEQFRETDNGLLVHRGAEIWTQNSSARRYISTVDDIEAAMRFYYQNRDKIEEHGQNAREYVVEHYDWDHLYEEFWKPFFTEIEEELEDTEYDQFYFQRREAETHSGAFRDEAFRISRKSVGPEVIDVGCGTGTLIEFLDEQGYEVTGVEYADAGIEKCREKELDVMKGDIRDLQLKDDSFNTAISQHVLEHIEADAQALAELARIASDKVVSVVPGKTPGSLADDCPDDTEKRRYDEDELDRLAEEFSSLTDHEVEYEEIMVGGNRNWVLEVEL